MSDAVLNHAKSVLAATREELDRADGKASLLLASAGVGIGVVIAALLAGSWDPSKLRNSVEWIWWLGGSAIVAAVLALGVAVYPRTRAKGSRPDLISYYADVAMTPATELEARLEQAIGLERSSVIDQLRQVSLIVMGKYRAIRWALCLLCLGAVLCGGSVLLNTALSA